MIVGVEVGANEGGLEMDGTGVVVGAIDVVGVALGDGEGAIVSVG